MALRSVKLDVGAVGGRGSENITLVDPLPASRMPDLVALDLLSDLERRQDEVLAQLDNLDRKLCGILEGLGVTPIYDEQSVGQAFTVVAEGERADGLDHQVGTANCGFEDPVDDSVYESGFTKLPATDLKKVRSVVPSPLGGGRRAA